MSFKISYNGAGEPVHVLINDGFMQCSRPYNPDTDGWMLDQLDPTDFPIILAGRQMQALVAEVNALRRENWQLQRRENVVFGNL